MMRSIRIWALLLLAIGAVHTTIAQEAPANDQCESATDVATFPFTDSASFEYATLDTFNYTCMNWNGSDVWYIFPDISEGMEVSVTITGINGEVQGQILASNDELGSCPDNFLCPDTLIASSIDSSGSNSASITTIAEAGLSYYLVLYSRNTMSGTEFDVYVDVVESGSTSSTTAVALDSREPPTNDNCTSATEVTAFPFTDSGSLSLATIDAFNFTCMSPWEGSDVWYVFPNISEGAELQVSISGFNAEVQGQILVSNNELGSCPDNFLCPAAITMSSSIDSSGSTGTSIYMTAVEADAIYYLVLYSTSNDIGPEFEVYIDVVESGTTSSTPAATTDAEEPLVNETLEPVPDSTSTSAPESSDTPASAPADSATKSSGCKKMVGSLGAIFASMCVLLNLFA